jgi:translation initiation factor IF-2
MAEEQNKEKPRIALIKHKKEDVSSPSTAAETEGKKKVVVVKKKVLVKKGSPKPSDSSIPQAESPPEETSIPIVAVEPAETEKAPVEQKEELLKKTPPVEQNELPSVPPISPSPVEIPVKKQDSNDRTGFSPRQPQSFPTKRPFTESSSERTIGRDTQGREFRTQSRPGPYSKEGGQRQPSGSFRPSFRTDRRPPSNFENHSVPYSRTGGRAGIVGGKPVHPPKPPAKPSQPVGVGAEEGKQTNKKVFKAKKKEYVKHEKIQEKEIQIKKKAVNRVNPVPKSIDIMEVITVSELAKKMNLKASELISKLMGMGMMVTINQQIDAETASILAAEYDCKVNIVSLYDETVIHTSEDRQEDLQKRPPIVTIMGHVDHGKTKLLDAIRTSHVAEGEYGGITQHIGAYSVQVGGEMITFLDTPGHEAFSMMRARGAQITDIVVLVVAANDGVMPQTVEAINHAKEAKVPIIVAINKIDLPDANPDRVKQQLSEYDLIPEEWGGKTLYVNISALKKIGIQELLETIILQAEILELKANYNCPAEGKVIESKIDHGRGIVATVLIQRGTLKIGDTFVAGIYPGKVRALFNDRGGRLEKATPSMPVEVLGFTGVPEAGDPFQVTENEKISRQIGDKRQELKKMEEAKNLKRITLDNLYESIQEGAVQELKVVIKGDVHGSVEALKGALEKLSTSEIRLSVIHASAGAINEGDVRLASASNAIIIGFHVRPTPKAQQLADVEKVEIRKYNIIYDAVDDIRAAMEGLLKPELKEETLGTVEVRNVFKVPKIGTVAGCFVLSGKIRRNGQVHIIRDGIELYTGKISSLKRFKEDAREVEAGFECGVGIENFQDIRVGDVLEVFEIKEVAKKLGEE